MHLNRRNATTFMQYIRTYISIINQTVNAKCFVHHERKTSHIAHAHTRAYATATSNVNSVNCKCLCQKQCTFAFTYKRAFRPYCSNTSRCSDTNHHHHMRRYGWGGAPTVNFTFIFKLATVRPKI